MSRITRTNLENTLTAFAEAVGAPRATNDNPRGLALDYASAHGGYKVIEIRKNGVESDVFGASRCSAPEMWSKLSFAMQAVTLSRASPKSGPYELQAGRSILRNGAPFVTLRKEEAISPADADEAARILVAALNAAQ